MLHTNSSNYTNEYNLIKLNVNTFMLLILATLYKKQKYSLLLVCSLKFHITTKYLISNL